MKKLMICVFIIVIGLMFTVPSFALENQFSGNWRTRMYSQDNFDGEGDTLTGDTSLADTRFRLYYTAIINDNLKLVSAWEMGDTVWGSAASDAKSYGDIGADGLAVEVKNLHVDFTIGEVTAMVGTQYAKINRGFVFGDEFSGIVVTNGTFTGAYGQAVEGGANAGDDVSMYLLAASFKLDNVTLAPAFTYIDLTGGNAVYNLGLDVDATLGGVSLWGTAIYQGGELTDTVDASAWLAAAGFSTKLSDMVTLRGQAIYATGDDDAADDENEAFTDYIGWVAGSGVTAGKGASYYWAEIMGLGIFDNQASNNSPSDDLSNVTALNLGVTLAPMDKVTVKLDIWYAMVNEELSAGLDEALGTEIDAVITYQLVPGLNLDLVGAYLFAGDSTTDGAVNDENPWEVGTQLSLSF